MRSIWDVDSDKSYDHVRAITDPIIGSAAKTDRLSYPATIQLKPHKHRYKLTHKFNVTHVVIAIVCT